MYKFFRSLYDLVFVPKCGGCHKRLTSTSEAICSECKSKYLNEKEEFCDFCGLAVRTCTCIPNNLKVNGCIDFRKLVFYRKEPGAAVIRSMIYRIKRNNDSTLITFFANELAKIDEYILPDNPIVTYAPRTAKAIRIYGYDHGKLLAQKYAQLNNLEFKHILSRKWTLNQKQQKLMNFSQRAANIKGAFEVCDRNVVYGRNVILIDDVVTSGATLGECTAMLYEAGARSVSCRSIAYTYRKNKQKND